MTAWLFRHRGATAVPLAILVAISARPTIRTLAAGTAVMLLGEALRVWAAAHIGAHSRGRVLRAPRLVTSGPYALLRHPLYMGNALLSAGLLIGAWPRWGWVSPLAACLFAGQYALFTRAEERLLAAAWPAEWAAYAVRTGPWFPRGGPGGSPLRPIVTRSALRQEWPTIRTVLFLLAFLVGVRLLPTR